jgi:hypothetical protein
VSVVTASPETAACEAFDLEWPYPFIDEVERIKEPKADAAIAVERLRRSRLCAARVSRSVRAAAPGWRR